MRWILVHLDERWLLEVQGVHGIEDERCLEVQGVPWVEDESRLLQVQGVG